MSHADDLASDEGGGAVGRAFRRLLLLLIGAGLAVGGFYAGRWQERATLRQSAAAFPSAPPSSPPTTSPVAPATPLPLPSPVSVASPAQSTAESSSARRAASSPAAEAPADPLRPQTEPERPPHRVAEASVADPRPSTSGAAKEGSAAGADGGAASRARPPAAKPRPARSAPPISGRPATGTEVPPPPAPPRVARSFASGATSVESLKQGGGKGLSGFDTAGVKRAPDVPGRIEFEMSPETVKAGDGYQVRVYLVNDGKKAIRLEKMTVSVESDGQRSARDFPPRSQAVAVHERALLAELPGVWKDAASWNVDVAVTSKRQDVYRNQFTWK
jgi:hypothetical protein